MNDKSLLVKIKSTVNSVEDAASLDDVANLKKLKGNEGYFRIRIGDYRLGLFLEGETILFVRVIHRREFYRYFP
ncbi:MAG: plasmid stabilization protein [Leptolyngbya sp.]|nr:MAG: plasmid stabilization protein [Leptolyngbya sp.]